MKCEDWICKVHHMSTYVTIIHFQCATSLRIFETSPYQLSFPSRLLLYFSFRRKFIFVSSAHWNLKNLQSYVVSGVMGQVLNKFHGKLFSHSLKFPFISKLCYSKLYDIWNPEVDSFQSWELRALCFKKFSLYSIERVFSFSCILLL